MRRTKKDQDIDQPAGDSTDEQRLSERQRSLKERSDMMGRKGIAFSVELGSINPNVPCAICGESPSTAFRISGATPSRWIEIPLCRKHVGIQRGYFAESMEWPQAEGGITIPKYRMRALTSDFDRMKVGDSILFNVAENATRIASAAARYGKTHGWKRFTVRKVEEGGTEGIRCWRTH